MILEETVARQTDDSSHQQNSTRDSKPADTTIAVEDPATIRAHLGKELAFAFASGRDAEARGDFEEAERAHQWWADVHDEIQLHDRRHHDEMVAAWEAHEEIHAGIEAQNRRAVPAAPRCRPQVRVRFRACTRARSPRRRRSRTTTARKSTGDPNGDDGNSQKKSDEVVPLLVVDLDHVAEDHFAVAIASLAPYWSILHARPSDGHARYTIGTCEPGAIHGQSCPSRTADRCVRVIFVLSRPVTSDERPRFWRAAMALLKQPADPLRPTDCTIRGSESGRGGQP